jgi:hypothetical protein
MIWCVRLPENFFVGCSVRGRRNAIGITIKGDRRHSDYGTFGKPLFQIVVLRVAFSQAQPPAVIVNHDADVIRIVEGRCGAIERGIIEIPLWGVERPDELRKIMPVGVEAGSAAFRGKIVLIPPSLLDLGRQRQLVAFKVVDQIAIHRDQGLAALRPKRRDDIGRPRSPIIAGEDSRLDPEGIHQSDDIESDHRLLTVPERFT